MFTPRSTATSAGWGEHLRLPVANQTRHGLVPRTSVEKVLALRTRRVLSLLASALSAAGLAAAQPYRPGRLRQLRFLIHPLPSNSAGRRAPTRRAGAFRPSLAAGPQLTPIPYGSLPTLRAAARLGPPGAPRRRCRRGDGPGVRAAMSRNPPTRSNTRSRSGAHRRRAHRGHLRGGRRRARIWPAGRANSNARSRRGPSPLLSTAAGAGHRLVRRRQAAHWQGRRSPRPCADRQRAAADAQQVIRWLGAASSSSSRPRTPSWPTFGVTLTANDHAARVDLLLYGGHTAAAQRPYAVPAADSRPSPRPGWRCDAAIQRADALVAALPAALQDSPGIASRRPAPGEAAWTISPIAARLPISPRPVRRRTPVKHGSMVIDALRQGDTRGAYAVAAHSGLTTGPNAAEAQFLARLGSALTRSMIRAWPTPTSPR